MSNQTAYTDAELDALAEQIAAEAPPLTAEAAALISLMRPQVVKPKPATTRRGRQKAA